MNRRRDVRRGLLGVALLAATVLAGCSTTDRSAPPPDRVFRAGERIRVAEGETFVVELAANPTTGYSWAAEPNPNAELVGSRQVRESERPGAPGRQRLRFRAVEPGSSTLVLEYRRPWESGGPPAETEKLRLRVRR